MICLSWVQRLLCQRSAEVGLTQQQRATLKDALQSRCTENIIKRCWVWYDALMFSRRLQQLAASNDRKDILAMDGNAKLHRRSCGQPFAEAARRKLEDSKLALDPLF